MARVALEQLTKIYPGGVKAVDAVSLDVAHGEFVVLVGPSGCGKSTTLRMVAGLEEISGGTLTIGDRVCNEVPARDRDIAMVFQSYALYPHLTVEKNLSFGLERRRAHRSSLRRMVDGDYRAKARAEETEIREKIGTAAATLGIEQLLQRKPGELSGGQRQRVAVGRALVREPEVFLFDEPLSNLDAKLRVEMRAEIKDLHRATGATMMYVTHDQEEAMTLGDRLVVMSDGVVQQCAPPAEVYARPANRFVASFVGTPTMNFLEGRVEAGTFRSAAGVLEVGERFPAGAIVLGVRPDRVRIAQEAAGLSGNVRITEHLGDRTDVRVDLAEDVAWTVRVPESNAEAGDVVGLQVDPSDLLAFHAETGARIEPM
ncbi:MAG: ATP-binding cassette domain-containing protein [Planctomycetota bacterium]